MRDLRSQVAREARKARARLETISLLRAEQREFPTSCPSPVIPGDDAMACNVRSRVGITDPMRLTKANEPIKNSSRVAICDCVANTISGKIGSKLL